MTTMTRTAVNAQMQTSIYLKMPHVIMPYSTLNQLHNILPNDVFSETEMPSMKYMAIGNKGHRSEAGIDGISVTKAIPHETTHTGMYNQLPFVLRLPTDDLTTIARAQYRLRKTVSINGVTYIAYYLRVLDLTDTIPKLELRVTEDGVTTATDFEFTPNSLRPTLPVIGTNQVLVTSGNAIASTARITFKITAEDAEELRSVARILYGDENYAIVSELSPVTGIDRLTSGEVNGVPIQYHEVVGAQIASFMNTYYPFSILRNGAEIDLDIGNTEALLSLVDRSTIPTP